MEQRVAMFEGSEESFLVFVNAKVNENVLRLLESSIRSSETDIITLVFITRKDNGKGDVRIYTIRKNAS